MYYYKPPIIIFTFTLLIYKHVSSGEVRIGYIIIQLLTLMDNLGEAAMSTK